MAESVRNPCDTPAVTITPLDGQTTTSAPSTSTSSASLEEKDTDVTASMHPLPSVCNLPKAIQGAFGIIDMHEKEMVKKRRITCREARVIAGTEVEKRLSGKSHTKSKSADTNTCSADKLDDKCQKCLKDVPPRKKGRGKGMSNTITWVSCDKCNLWFHCVCVNIRKDSIPDNYFCFKCDKAN